jgi:virginiamycin B lyase
VRPNTLVRFDPQGEKFQTWAIPSGGHVIRHMMASANGNLVLAESGINKVALVEVAGGNTRTN